jgi:eukaryotic-like serine/threonine-protein kinase
VTEVHVPPQDAFVRAKIKVTPPDAKILVDGSELPSNPFEGKFIRDGAAHRIEMQAPGFVPQRRMLVFNSDLDLEVTLYIAQKPAAPSAAITAVPTAPAATTGTDVVVPPPKPDPY